MRLSKPTETLFEMNVDDKTVSALGILLDVELEKVKILINDVEVNRTMKVSNLKIVKEY